MEHAIKLGPDTWEKAMPVLIHVLEVGNNEGRKMAREELMRLAKAVDEMQEKEKE